MNTKGTIFTDVKAAVRLTSEIRKARKAGADGVQVEVRPTWTLPAVKLAYWGFTPEGCLFYGKKWKPLRDVFDSFDEETQHALTFPPEDGEWADRVRFWRRELRPALDPELYHEAMLILIQWCIRCVRKGVEQHG